MWVAKEAAPSVVERLGFRAADLASPFWIWGSPYMSDHAPLGTDRGSWNVLLQELVSSLLGKNPTFWEQGIPAIDVISLKQRTLPLWPISCDLGTQAWGTTMLSNWIAAEHYRLHLVERWPDSPHKQATLAAVYSTLASLEQDSRSAAASQECVVCRARRAAVVEFQSALRINSKNAVSARSHPHRSQVATAGAVGE